MLNELNRKEKAYILIVLALMVGCYNAYTVVEFLDYQVSFPFYRSHSEPIAWYVKDLGFRISIFLLSTLMHYLIQDRLNWKYLLLIRGLVVFLGKDVIDYIICYDQFTAIWDIIAYIGIILYVIFKK